MKSRANRLKELSGFTAVELLASVALLVLLTAVVLPRMSFYGDLNVQAVADGLRRDLAGVRLHAEKSGSRQRLETSAEQYRFGPAGEPPTSSMDLPSGIALPPGLVIEFDSLGRPWRVVSGGAQLLAAAENIPVSSAAASVTVRVEPLTGLARVMR